MSEKKKIVLFYTMLPFLLVSLIFLYLFINSLISRDQMYYIPQAKLYIKIVRPFMDKNGYVFFDKNYIVGSSRKIDYIKINRYPGVEIFINPSVDNELYITSVLSYNNNAILHINQANYKIEKVQYEGNIYYEMPHLPDFLTDGRFIKIEIGEYCQSVSATSVGDDRLKSIKPVK